MIVVAASAIVSAAFVLAPAGLIGVTLTLCSLPWCPLLGAYGAGRLMGRSAGGFLLGLTVGGLLQSALYTAFVFVLTPRNPILIWLFLDPRIELVPILFAVSMVEAIAIDSIARLGRLVWSLRQVASNPATRQEQGSSLAVPPFSQR